MRQRKDSRGRYRSRGISTHAVLSQPKSTVIEWASPVQEEAFRYGPAPMCLSGGFGSGKTVVAALKILYLSQLFPGYRTVIARKVWEDLRKSTMATFFKFCPVAAYQFGKRADTEKLLQLNPILCDDGVSRQSEILWLHLDSVESEKVIRGLEANSFFGDQAEELDEDIVDLVDSRLGRWDQAYVPQALIDAERAAGREWAWWNTPDGQFRPGAKPIPPSYLMLAVNPDTFLHWIYRRFHEDSPDHWLKHIPDEETGELRSYHDLGYRMFHMDSLDNRFLPKQTRLKLLSKDKTFVDRFVHGKWGIPEGQIHHVTPLSEIPGDPTFVDRLVRTSALHRVLDHGDSSPTACGWVAVTPEGDVIFYREYYEPGKLIREHRALIAALSQFDRDRDRDYETDLADPSIFAKVAQIKGGRRCVADEYKDCEPPYTERDAIYWRPADNNELGTRDRINDYLRVDPERIHPYTGQKGAPRLFFVMKSREHPHGCYHIVQEMKSQRRVRIGTVNGVPQFSDERDEEVPDHGYDLARYELAARPAGPVEAPRQATAGSYNAVRLAYKASRLADGSVKIPGERVRSRWRR